MVIELTLGNVITLAALLIAAVWALLKVISTQQEKRQTERFDEITNTLKTIVQAQEGNARSTQELERQFMQHQVALARDYVRRDDFVRDIGSLGTRIDNFALRVERALEHLGEK